MIYTMITKLPASLMFLLVGAVSQIFLIFVDLVLCPSGKFQYYLKDKVEATYLFRRKTREVRVSFHHEVSGVPAISVTCYCCTELDHSAEVECIVML